MRRARPLACALFPALLAACPGEPGESTATGPDDPTSTTAGSSATTGAPPPTTASSGASEPTSGAPPDTSSTGGPDDSTSTSTSTSSSSEGDTMTTEDSGGIACEGSGFADSPQSWTLPALPDVTGNLPLDMLSRSGGCVDPYNYYEYFTLDVTGDGVIDLLLTDDCTADGVGASQWRVHAGGPAGFADSPQSWNLPALPGATGAQPLDMLARSGGCVDPYNYYEYFTLDVTGDGVVDLVLTDDCTADGVGASQWRVYPGGPAGFADSPQSWNLPALPGATGAQPLDMLARSGGCVDPYDYYEYFTLDVTGDGVVDLVLTDDCTADGVGVSQWRVHPGGPAGFADSPQSWNLPALPGVTGAQPLDMLSRSGGCVDPYNYYEYFTLDVTGDRVIDLVLTDDCTADGVGVSQWRVHPGGPAGFADSPQSWSLPALPGVTGAQPLDMLARSGGCVDPYNYYEYVALDATGDRVVDLVLTDDCTRDGVGATQWRIYPGLCQ